MGSGGTEWETNDLFSPIRMNQKGRFVGTGTQTNSLISSPQIGQCVYATDTYGSFTQSNKTYFLDHLQTSWVNNTWGSTEWTDSGGSSPNLNVNASNDDRRYYRFVTVPSTYKFYIITHLEIQHSSGGPAANITFQLGADLVNSATPTTNSQLISISPWVSFAHPDATTTKLNVSSKTVKAGDILGLWVNGTFSGSNNWTFYAASGTSTIYYKSATCLTVSGTVSTDTWSTETNYIPSIKVYAKGFI